MLELVPFRKDPKFKDFSDDRLIEIVDRAKAEIADHEKAIQKVKDEYNKYYEELYNRAGLEQDDEHPKGICIRYMHSRGWRNVL